MESIPSAKRLALLQHYLQFKHGFASKMVIARSRKEFEAIGSTLCPLDVCYVCGGMPSQRHHVIPLFFNGENTPGNLVPLCSDCHNDVHSANSENMAIFYNHPVFGWEPNQFHSLAAGRKRYRGPKSGSLSSFSGIAVGFGKNLSPNGVDNKEVTP